MFTKPFKAVNNDAICCVRRLCNYVHMRRATCCKMDAFKQFACEMNISTDHASAEAEVCHH